MLQVNVKYDKLPHYDQTIPGGRGVVPKPKLPYTKVSTPAVSKQEEFSAGASQIVMKGKILRERERECEAKAMHGRLHYKIIKEKTTFAHVVRLGCRAKVLSGD